MTARYVIKDKTTGKYYRSARARHLFENWVDDIQLASILYSGVNNSRFSDKRYYEKVYIKIMEEENEYFQEKKS